MWSRWKEKVIGAEEKGIGRKKVSKRSEGCWLDNVERLIIIRKMTYRKLREGREEWTSEPTMGELQKSTNGSEKGYHERKEGIEELDSEKDQKAGWYQLQMALD